MQWLGFALAIVLVTWTAWCFAASLRLPAVATSVAAIVVAFTVIVASSEALSFSHAFTAAGLLGSHAVTAVVASVVWVRAGRPRPAVDVRAILGVRRGLAVLFVTVVIAISVQ